MARMLATFLLLLSLGVIIFNHVDCQDSEASNQTLQIPAIYETDSSYMYEPYINDCSDVNPSGVFKINQPGPEPGTSFHAYCSFEVGGGWTVFQQRFDGSLDFYRGWEDYVDGFGSYDSEFWLGLSKLHQLTKNGNWRMKVLLEDWDGSTAHAEYASFSIGDEASNYQLTIGGYSGTACDSMTYHNGWAFTTKDRDNDSSTNNCAERWKGAWWYTDNTCYKYSNLNGLYMGPVEDYTGMIWYCWKNSWKPLKSSTMMIRPN